MGCEASRLSHFLDSRLTGGGDVVSLTRRPHFTPQEDFWYSFLLQVESTPRAIAPPEELRQLKNPDIGNRIRDLPACSIVPQPTTLPLIVLFLTEITFGDSS
jgi:hypothetical protein